MKLKSFTVVSDIKCGAHGLINACTVTSTKQGGYCTTESTEIHIYIIYDCQLITLFVLIIQSFTFSSATFCDTFEISEKKIFFSKLHRRNDSISTQFSTNIVLKDTSLKI